MAILHQLRDRGHTVIIVTHDPQVAAQAERVIEIRDGEIVRNPPAIEKVNATGGTEPVVNTASGWRQFVSGFNEALTMAWRALAANKMRTLLTMLGDYYRYCVGGFHCRGGRRRQTNGAGGYSFYWYEYY